MTAPRLIFPAAPTEQSGFASADADRASRGYAEPVIRELLQNCLDARRRPGGVRVTISLRQVAVSQIPALGGYKRAFETAVSNRREGGMFSQPDKAVVDRINGVLNGKMWVLTCRDDGSGLTADTMSRLLSEGNTDKRKKGAGSVGLGHLTAFGASDLRYVLYGARGAQGRIVSGRCLLAAHQPQGEKVSRSHKGTLALKEIDTRKLFDPPFEYLPEPPPLLRPEMDRILGTGTVVIILGFNNFGEDPAQAMEYVVRTAAASFSPAICDGRMKVEVTGQEGGTTTLDSPESVGAALSEQGHLIRSQRWRFPEGLAHRAWRTLREGKVLPNGAGAEVRFRPLNPEWGERYTRVNIFREGMWITNRYYSTSDFSGRMPFDAVVLADPDIDERFSELIRNSEGADHYDIIRAQLSSDDQRELRGKLDEIKDALLTEAELLSEETWRPPGFAAFGKKTGTVRRPRPLPPRPTIRVSEEGEGESMGDDDYPDPEPEPGPGPGPGPGPVPGPEPGPNLGPKPGPRPGKTASVSLAFRELALDEDDDSGVVQALRVAFRPHSLGRLGVRVMYATGGDETCDASPRPEFLQVRSGSSASLGLDQSGEWEVLVPADCFSFELELPTPALRSRGPLALDVVERR